MSKSERFNGTDPYQEGWDACINGKSRKRNPYSKGSDNFLDWDAGWQKCQAENQAENYDFE